MSADRQSSSPRKAREKQPRTVHQVFSTRDLARLAGIAPSRVRRCVHSGLLPAARGSRRRFEFTLRDLLTLRATLPLLHAGVGPRRLSSIASQIRRELAADRSLSSLRIQPGANQSVLVSDGSRTWELGSGQMVLPFASKTQSSRRGQVRPIDPEANAADEAREISVLLQRATLLERSDGVRARELYAEVLRRDLTRVVAHINLGRLLHEAGSEDAAEQHYRQALHYEPANSTAQYNLGVLAEHRGDLRAALRYYRQAITTDPSFNDAHQQIPRVLRRLGESGAAKRHLQLHRSALRGQPKGPSDPRGRGPRRP